MKYILNLFTVYAQTSTDNKNNDNEISIGMIKSSLNSIVDHLPNLVFAIIILIIGYFLSKLCLKLMSKGLSKSKLDPTAHSFLKSLVKVTLYIILIVIVLTILGVPTSSIVAVIGASGLAIGLALQNSLSNVAGGFLILFSNPFEVGDYIKVGSDEGTVQAISILYTRLLTIDNKAIYIPNGQVSNATVTNYTDEKLRMLDLTFSIAYENDFNVAKKLIEQVVRKNPLSILEPEPLIRVTKHASSSIDIICRVWVLAENYFPLKYDLNEDIKTVFDENGISIPYNQLDVLIKENK